MSDEVKMVVGQKFILVDWRKLIGHPHENPTERCQCGWLVHMGLSDSALYPKNLNLRTHNLPLTQKPRLETTIQKGHSIHLLHPPRLLICMVKGTVHLI